MAVSGNKADLVSRLEAHSDAKEHQQQDRLDIRNYQRLRVADLKKECKKYGLKMTGKKTDLIARLELAETKKPSLEKVVELASTSSRGHLLSTKDYNAMSVLQLKNELRSKG